MFHMAHRQMKQPLVQIACNFCFDLLKTHVPNLYRKDNKISFVIEGGTKVFRLKETSPASQKKNGVASLFPPPVETSNPSGLSKQSRRHRVSAVLHRGLVGWNPRMSGKNDVWVFLVVSRIQEPL